MTPEQRLAAMMDRNDALLDAETEMIDQTATERNTDATEHAAKGADDAN